MPGPLLFARGRFHGQLMQRAHLMCVRSRVWRSRWSFTRPGVPTTMSTPLRRALSWGPYWDPPYRHSVARPQPLPMWSKSACTCSRYPASGHDCGQLCPAPAAGAECPTQTAVHSMTAARHARACCNASSATDSLHMLKLAVAQHGHCTCLASSRVGVSTMTRGLRPRSGCFPATAGASRSTMGSTKARVLPQPVLQQQQAQPCLLEWQQLSTSRQQAFPSVAAVRGGHDRWHARHAGTWHAEGGHEAHLARPTTSKPSRVWARVCAWMGNSAAMPFSSSLALEAAQILHRHRFSTAAG